jgi:MFS family permease
MVAADLVRCVIMLLFVYLMVFTSSWGALGPFLPLMLVGVFAAVFAPAREAMLPSLIQPDQLVRANGLMAGLGIIAAMFAAVISGYLADHYSPKVSFRVDASTFFASAMLLTFLRPPRLHEMRTEHGYLAAAIGDVVDGFRYVRQHRRVIELLAIAGLVWFCGSLVRCAMPAIVRDVYAGSYQHIGTFQAFLGVGFILGAIIVGILGDALRSEIAITWGLFGISVAILLFALSVFLPLSPGILYVVGAVGVTGAGIFGLGVMASFNALLQRIVPDRYRGRVFGIKNLVTIGALLAATGGLGLPQWQRVDRWVGSILIGVAVLTAAAAMITLNVRLSRSPQSRGILVEAAADRAADHSARRCGDCRRQSRDLCGSVHSARGRALSADIVHGCIGVHGKAVAGTDLRAQRLHPGPSHRAGHRRYEKGHAASAGRQGAGDLHRRSDHAAG